MSIVPEAMSCAPARVDVDAGIGEHRALQLVLATSGTRRWRSHRAGPLRRCSRPAGAARRRAAPSSRGSGAGRSCSGRRQGGSRSAGARRERRPACAHGRARSPWRRSIRRAAAAGLPGAVRPRCARAFGRRRCERVGVAGVGEQAHLAGGAGARLRRRRRLRLDAPASLAALAACLTLERDGRVMPGGGRQRRLRLRRRSTRAGSELAPAAAVFAFGAFGLG